MLQEIVHRLISKKLFAAMSAALLATGLVVLAIFRADKDTTVAIVTFMGAPAMAALGWFVHAQGQVDKADAVSQTTVREQ